MRYVVIINLDYENFEHGRLKALFADISSALQERGFVRDGRRFSIDVDPLEAQRLARLAVDELEQQYNARGESIYASLKEFFGFEVENAVNLLLPPGENIEVSELEDVEGLLLTDLLKR